MGPVRAIFARGGGEGVNHLPEKNKLTYEMNIFFPMKISHEPKTHVKRII